MEPHLLLSEDVSNRLAPRLREDDVKREAVVGVGVALMATGTRVSGPMAESA